MAKRVPNSQIAPYCASCGGYVSHNRNGKAVTFVGGYRTGDEVTCKACLSMERDGLLVRI